VVNNLVIAFVINSFLHHLERTRAKAAEGAEVVGDEAAEIRNGLAVFDASTVAGTSTFLTGAYVARFRRAHSAGARNDESDTVRLRQLFDNSSVVP
jgi:hypothetical protein